jgi:Concanavalin A-like lectin/glucanases superfamily
VLPTSNVRNAVIAYNGNTSNAGWGLVRNGNDYAILYGGKVLAGGANSVDLNQWTHLALVRASGTTTLYKNGIAIQTTGTEPNPPAGGFGIGINPTADAEYFAGNIDEVRMFILTDGAFTLRTQLQFADAQLVVPTVTPAAFAFGILLLLVAGVCGTRRRARARSVLR